MKIHLLRYFIVLAEELHFGRAARRLCITQPPLSMALKALEQELGVRLMERDAKQVQLTAAGLAFLQEARRLLVQIEHAGEVARKVASGGLGRLDIGITGSMIYRKAPLLFERFAQQSPQVQVCLHEMSTNGQLKALLGGELDAGFVNIGQPPAGLQTLFISEDPLVCCLPAGHRLAGSETIDLRQLAGDTFVMFARETSAAAYDSVIACLQQAGIHPPTRHAARQWLTVIGLVSVGQGVALVPQGMQQCGLSGVRFVALPAASRKHCSRAFMAWRTDFNGNPALQQFIDMARLALAQPHGCTEAAM